MVPMISHYTIRPTFVIAHYQREEDGWTHRMAINAEAQRQEKELNREYGLAEDPDSPFATTHHNAGAEYRTRRDAITAKARELYSSSLARVENADRADQFTIYEFLLLDNMSDRAKAAVLRAASQAGVADFIGLRASAELAELADAHSIGHVRERMPKLISHFDYAGRRCRQFFGVRIWDWKENKAIRRFKGEYRDQLQHAFDGLRTSGAVRGRW